jgi:DNA-binding NtrC family response regulator
MQPLIPSAATRQRYDAVAAAESPAVTPVGLACGNPPVRILVVDDDDGIRWLVRRILEEAGYAVVTACGGVAALGAARSAMTDRPGAIHLVLTDLDMPGGEGCELGRQLAARWPALPVIYMSGTTYGFARRARLSEHEHFIEKPFPAEALLGKISLVLRLGARVRPAAAEAASPHDTVMPKGGCEA